MSTHFEQPHRRYNPLIGEWILCSPHRAKRPWLGQKESVNKEKRPQYDPSCYLCPGNDRTSGITNPNYEHTYVFPNDFPALLNETEDLSGETNPLFKAEGVTGTSRVICFSPNHGETLAQMSHESIQKVIQTWKSQAEELGKTYRWVQLFENKGAAMGCSNPHPHGQIWAMDQVPTLPAKEDVSQKAYFEKNKSQLLLDYAQEELKRKDRIVCQSEDWLVVVPFWAVWPFETLLLPTKRVITRITDLTEKEEKSLSVVLKSLLTKYDALFDCDFPYSMGWHGAPFNGEQAEHWQLHAHFYPPLLRSATVKKFMVGFEMMAEAQRDITAETAAQRLRDL